MMIGYSIDGFEEVFPNVEVKKTETISESDYNPYSNEQWYELMKEVEQHWQGLHRTPKEWKELKESVLRMRKKLHSLECDMEEIVRITREYDEEE